MVSPGDPDEKMTPRGSYLRIHSQERQGGIEFPLQSPGEMGLESQPSYGVIPKGGAVSPRPLADCLDLSSTRRVRSERYTDWSDQGHPNGLQGPVKTEPVHMSANLSTCLEECIPELQVFLDPGFTQGLNQPIEILLFHGEHSADQIPQIVCQVGVDPINKSNQGEHRILTEDHVA